MSINTLNVNAAPFASKWRPENTGQESKEAVLTISLPDGLAKTLDDLFHPVSQKIELGNHLYPLVNEIQPELASKVTGMLLQKEISELVHWLECPSALLTAVNKAVAVLNTPSPSPTDTQPNPNSIEETTTDQKHEGIDTIPSQSAQSHYHSASLCIQNLHPSFTQPLLFERFDRIAQFAPVSSIRVCHDLGLAFVHFSCEDDALRALVEVGSEFGVDESDVIVETDLY
jgi:hypothetical protein